MPVEPPVQLRKRLNTRPESAERGRITQFAFAGQNTRSLGVLPVGVFDVPPERLFKKVGSHAADGATLRS